MSRERDVAFDTLAPDFVFISSLTLFCPYFTCKNLWLVLSLCLHNVNMAYLIVFLLSLLVIGYLLKMYWLIVSSLVLLVLTNSINEYTNKNHIAHKYPTIFRFSISLLRLLVLASVLYFVLSGLAALNTLYLGIGLWLLIALIRFVLRVIYQTPN